MKRLIALIIVLVLLVGCAPLNVETEDKVSEKTEEKVESEKTAEVAEAEKKAETEKAEAEKTDETDKKVESEETKTIGQGIKLLDNEMEEKLVNRDTEYTRKFFLINDNFIPSYLQVQEGYAELQFVNKDSWAHEVRIQHKIGKVLIDKIIKVEPRQTGSIKIDLNKGEVKVFDEIKQNRVKGNDLLIGVEDKLYYPRLMATEYSYTEVIGMMKDKFRNRESFDFVKNNFEDLELIETINADDAKSVLKTGKEEIYESKQYRRLFTRHVETNAIVNMIYQDLN